MADKLVWIDCEMTGLDLARDALIEVAAVVTDADLNVLGEGVDVVVHASDEALTGMPDVVAAMHAKSGLTDAVRVSAVTVADAERMVLDYVRAHVPEPRTAPLCGNSIATDRAFIARDMPELDAFLHYRMVDVSSIKELARRWYPRVYFAQPVKGLAHRALADIRESIRELRYYRQTVFVHPTSRARLSSCRAAGDRGHGGCSSAGRAPGCGPGCRGFKSHHSPRRPGLLCPPRARAQHSWTCEPLGPGPVTAGSRGGRIPGRPDPGAAGSRGDRIPGRPDPGAAGPYDRRRIVTAVTGVSRRRSTTAAAGRPPFPPHPGSRPSRSSQARDQHPFGLLATPVGQVFDPAVEPIT